MQPYDKGFFSVQAEGSFLSAEQVVPHILELTHASSVIDVGCGVGTWLAAFKAAGIDDLMGTDGDYVERSMLRVAADRFKPNDLTQPFQFDRTFDLAISLEVAEHLPAASAAGFVKSLVQLAPIIVFSGAAPGQGGVSHVNEQWPEYWRDLFAQEGYVLADCLRHRLWYNKTIQWHYRQNTLVFVRSSAVDSYPEIQPYLQNSGLSPLSIVHPEMYTGLLETTDPHSIPLKQSWGTFKTALGGFVRRRMHK